MCHQKSARLAMVSKFPDIINGIENERFRQEKIFGKEGTCGYI